MAVVGGSHAGRYGRRLVLEVHEVARRYVADHDAHVVDIDRRFDELPPSAVGPATSAVVSSETWNVRLCPNRLDTKPAETAPSE